MAVAPSLDEGVTGGDQNNTKQDSCGGDAGGQLTVPCSFSPASLNMVSFYNLANKVQEIPQTVPDGTEPWL